MFLSRPFSEFIFQFRFIDLGIAENKTKDSRDLALELLQKSGITKSDFQIGKTMVFLKPQAMKDMAKKQRECMAAWDPLVSVLEAMFARKLNQMEMAKYLPALTRFQAHARRYVIINGTKQRKNYRLFPVLYMQSVMFLHPKRLCKIVGVVLVVVIRVLVLYCFYSVTSGN